MEQAVIIDGKALAARVQQRVAERALALKREFGVIPGLAVVLVGENPASQVYVRNKARQTVACGMVSFEHALPATASEDELLGLIGELNRDDAVHGILVQLPLPGQVDPQRVIEAIDPAKDVDGFHPENVGRLSIGKPGFVPCTPAGCLLMLKSLGTPLAGLDAVVIGRSNIVGKPMAQLLLAENCTVTVAHSRTKDLPALVRRADVVVAAIGRPLFVQGDWIKPGAVVIDVGINRVPAGEPGRSRLVGDVAFDQVRPIARAVTPVPGGVGPMTIACLLENTVTAAERSCGSGDLPV